MFRKQLTSAAGQPPNFAGHYRFALWGCGSNCAAGAVIDLQTGEVFQPPLAPANGNGWERWIISAGMMEDSGIEFRPDSLLVIVRSGIHKNTSDIRYVLWEGTHFRLLDVTASTPAR